MAFKLQDCTVANFSSNLRLLPIVGWGMYLRWGKQKVEGQILLTMKVKAYTSVRNMGTWLQFDYGQAVFPETKKSKRCRILI